MKSASRLGFSLLELMVVLLITLLIMIMLTSIFVSTTKVVSTVELKLRLNEQSRGILDTMEEQIINACANERGGQFVIKGADFTDGDFDGYASDILDTNGKISKSGADSKRKIDTLDFVQETAGTFVMNNGPAMGGYAFSLFPSTVDYLMGDINSNVHYSALSVANQNIINNDICNMVYSIKKGMADLQDGSQIVVNADAGPHPLEPGYEINGYYSASVHIISNSGAANAAFIPNLANVSLMDMSIAVWCEKDRKFQRVPSLHAVYFAPIPKAVLISITVCDVYKKGRISFSRVISPPAGTGDGYFDTNTANADTGTVAKAMAASILAKYPKESGDKNTLISVNDKNNNYRWDNSEDVTSLLSLPLPYNRLKLLRTNGSTAGVDDFSPTFLDASIFKK